MRFDPASSIEGALTPPPDKSISHRAGLVAAMCEGRVRIVNYLRSQDTAATVAAIHELGAQIELHEPQEKGSDLEVRGVGLHGPIETEQPVDVGNAGTLIRLLPGWLAGQPGRRWTLDGDASIRRRPMDRVAHPLQLMGARVRCRDDTYAPLSVEGAELEGIDYKVPVASAQVKSCVLLAGLLARSKSGVSEPVTTRDHTERLLQDAGVRLRARGNRIELWPCEALRLDRVAVPGDFSSAAFLVVAATLLRTSDLLIESVGLNPTRTGLLGVLKRMGVSVERHDVRQAGGEPIGELRIRNAPLRGTQVSSGEVPLLIDELPLVALLGVFAEGTTLVGGAQELRHKESDRIAGVVEGLRGLGAQIEATADGFVVEGSGGLRGGVIDARGDHRLAMLGAVAGVASSEGVEVQGFEASAVSYPGFVGDLSAVLR
jgi:3-phosphoshikimate 1-carboxyvinyltransferase